MARYGYNAARDDSGSDTDSSDGVDVGDVLDGGGSSGSDPRVGGSGSSGGGSPGGSSPPPSDVGGPAPGPGDSPGGSSPPPSDVGGPSGAAPKPDGPGGSSPPAGDVGGPDPDAGGGASEPQPRGSDGQDNPPGDATRAMPAGPRDNPSRRNQFDDLARGTVGAVTGATANRDIVGRATTGGFLSERGESAGLLPPELGGIDISETRARRGVRAAAAFGDRLDLGAAFSSPASPLASGGQVREGRDIVDTSAETDGVFAQLSPDAENENPAEEFIEGGAQTFTNLPAGALQAETAAEVAQSSPGIAQDYEGSEIGETSVAVGRDIATETAAQASENPAEFAGGVAASAALGAGALSRGSTGGLGTAVRAELDPRVGPFGTTAETRLARGARGFLDDDRGQADLTGLGRRGGDGDGDAPTTIEIEDTGPLAVPDDARSQQLAQAGFRGRRRAAETRQEADLEDVARDPGPQTVSRRESRSVTGQEDVRSVSEGFDTSRSGPTATQLEAARSRGFGRDDDLGLSPRERQLAAQSDRPDQDFREAFGDYDQRFDQRGDAGLDAGGSGLFDVPDQAATGASVGGLLGGAADTDATGTTGGVDADTLGGVDLETGFGVGSDADSGVDIDTDVGPGIDTGTDVDTDTTPDLDDPTLTDPDGFDPIGTTDQYLTDPTPNDPPSRDPVDPPTTDPPTGDPVDPPDTPFDPDPDRDDEAPLFGLLSESGTFGSGILSGSEALAELYGDNN